MGIGSLGFHDMMVMYWCVREYGIVLLGHIRTSHIGCRGEVLYEDGEKNIETGNLV